MKRTLFKVFNGLGLTDRFRRWKQQEVVTIIMFHDPSPVAMERALIYLSEHYSIISLGTYLEARSRNTVHELPRYSLVITFDDGHIGNYDLLPLFERFRVPVTIFLCSAIVATNRHFWFLCSGNRKATHSMKTLTNPRRLQRLAALGFEEDREYSYPQALTANQVRGLKPYIDFQAHTRFHPILTRCSDDRAREEIIGGKIELAEKLGIHARVLAYPNGDHSARSVYLAKEGGYAGAVTVESGYNDAHTDIFRLRRLDLNDTEDVHEIAAKSSGLWQYLTRR